jgi:hypothetical protein
MRQVSLVAFFLFLLLPAPSRGAARAADAKPDLGANAATKYWQAFALLPALDKDQQKLLEKWSTVPLDTAALNLIARSRLSRMYLHRGAKLARCDWSPDYQDGIRLVLPHLGKARNLAILTALHARHEFEQGHWKTGAEDVTALLRLGRHLELDALIISNLVGYWIEAAAIEAAAPYLPELKAVLPRLAALDGHPSRATLQQMALLEKKIAGLWLIQELKKAEKDKEGSWQTVWKEVFEQGEHPDRELANAPKTFAEAVKMLENLLPWYDRQAKLMALPWKELDAQYPEFMKKARAANPLARYVLPGMHKVVAVQRRIQTQRALFKAALAVVQDGPDKVKDFEDPFGKGPFEYRALAKGFELKSKLLVKGQPLTLTVGTGKKE